MTHRKKLIEVTLPLDPINAESDGEDEGLYTASWSRRFYGVVEVNPCKLGASAGQIGQEVVQHLASVAGADVEITLEIRADAPEGVPDQVERIVSENCRTLKFKDFGFGDE